MKKRNIFLFLCVLILPVIFLSQIHLSEAWITPSGTPSITSIFIEQKKGSNLFTYHVDGYVIRNGIDIGDVVYFTVTNFTAIEGKSGYALTDNASRQIDMNNNYIPVWYSVDDFTKYTYSTVNNGSIMITSNSPTPTRQEILDTAFDWSITFNSKQLICNPIYGQLYISMDGYSESDGSFTTEDTFDLGTNFPYISITHSYSLQPIISIDSKHYNTENTRLEYTTDGSNWYESTFDSITIDSWQYKTRIYDSITNDLIHEDLDFVNFTRIREIEIDSFKFRNNGDEPVFFNMNNSLQYLVYPYTSSLTNITDSTSYEYNVTDLYNNILENNTIIPSFTDWYEINFTKPEMIDCVISYSDQQGNYLNWFAYKTKVNGTTVYDPIIQREVGDILNVSIYDRFDNYITSTLHTVTRNENWISLIITLRSLKIYNQQDSYAYINLTSTTSTAYWSEWVAPDEIIEYKLIDGDYQLNVTKYEETATTSEYNYTLVGDDILLINSQYTLLLLSQIYQMSVFSELVNWTDIYDDLTQIALYDFVNSFAEQNVRVYLQYAGSTDSIVVGAGDTISQIIPTNAINDVYYRVKNIETDEYITDWESLPENKTVDIGFYDTVIPATPEDLHPTRNSVIIGSLLSVVIIAVFGILYLRQKAQNSPQQSINRKLFMDEDTINTNVKNAKRRGGFYNLKGTMD